jgi:hypothetical protein
MPAKAVRCLTCIVEEDEEGWGILGWREDPRKVIATALNSANPVAEQLTRELVHRLGGIGYFDFRELLVDGL